jgi:hypothetical protein
MKLKKYLNEIELPKKKWIETNLSDLTDEQLENLWEMYINTYKYIDLSFNDIKEMKKDYKLLMLIDVDSDDKPDAFIIYKKAKGNKISFLGSDGSKLGKDALIKKFTELIFKKPWWIEASAKMETLCKKINAPIVDDENFVKTTLKKEIEWIGDGYYKRKLKKVDKYITKRIYGKPLI